ncbi:MAG: OsmC family protein [Anaerolineales bacterium]|uniref:OsmC family protein n=1 Tax=Candidatus Villigracilis affinis TaxID=3140682 RepID=UPI002A20009E|nr:OsmC family protein [Anaerolineales bacterium]MBL0344940.1 OsmC family protein [Anaerolineales bacterium]
MDVILNWKGRMLFEGVGGSGFVQKLDTDASVGGDDSGARPMEFIALGLAGCTAMDVISILQKKKQPVSDFKVQLHAERADEHPKVFTEAVIEYLVTGSDVDEAALLRAIELSAEKYCPAQAMLSKAFPIRMTYKILNDSGEVINEGEYFAKHESV